MGRNATLARLREAVPAIEPSMLKCDFGNLEAELARLQAAPTPVLHWDVMDGHFVPNLSYGALLIERLRPRTDLIFDAHLMISDPAKYLDDYIKAGCDVLTFHIEAVPEPRPLIDRIHAADRVAGLAINPQTPFAAIAPYLDDVEVVLVMTVQPGFGGQKFMPEVLPKLERIRQASADLLIAIDGGIATETICAAADAGADLFVAGSAVFDPDDYAAAITDLTALARRSSRLSSSTGRA